MNVYLYELKDRRQLVVREAEPSDAAALLEYLEQVSAETDFVSFGPGEIDSTVAQEAEFIRSCQSAEGDLFLIASIAEEIVGTLTFANGKRKRTRHAGELGMSVRKHCWGLGVGSRMMDVLIEWATKSDVVIKLNLRVRTDNLRAVTLYLHKGFTVEGTIRKDFCLDGKSFDHYWMGLELSSGSCSHG